jgi:hypothetical protein
MFRVSNSVLLLCAGLAAACAPLSIYYKPGVSVEKLQKDTLQCEVKALRDAPVANQIRQSPPRFIPPRQYCNGSKCYTRPGHWIPGHTYTVDVNKPLRKRVEHSCMANRGYIPAEIPACPSGVSQAAKGPATTRLPALNENSCFIRNDDGSFRIVTQG